MWDSPDLSGTITVETNGSFTFPLVGRVKAGGLTLPGQEEDAADTQRVNLRDLQSGALSQNVALRNGDSLFVPSAESIYVFGQVRSPDACALQSPETTVLQALSLAGGVTDRGATNRIKIVRVVNGEKAEIKVKLTDVKLHWALITPLCKTNVTDQELDGLWSRATPANVAGADVLMLSPADLLLHLRMHVSAHHRFNGIDLRSFVDIAEVCRRYQPEIDWTVLAARAGKWGVAHGVRLALDLAREWTGPAIPPEALAGLAHARVDEPTMTSVKHQVLNGTPVALNSEVSRLESDSGATGRLRTLCQAPFLPRAVMARLYPAPAYSRRIFAYYPVRAKDLWVRCRQTMWKQVTRDRRFVADAQKEARLRAYLGWQ